MRSFRCKRILALVKRGADDRGWAVYVFLNNSIVQLRANDLRASLSLKLQTLIESDQVETTRRALPSTR